jgi:hypothetical protein
MTRALLFPVANSQHRRTRWPDPVLRRRVAGIPRRRIFLVVITEGYLGIFTVAVNKEDLDKAMLLLSGIVASNPEEDDDTQYIHIHTKKYYYKIWTTKNLAKK